MCTSLSVIKLKLTNRATLIAEHSLTRMKATRCETLRTVTTNNSKKHPHLTYCLNEWSEVNGYNFFTSEPILLIVHENDLF